MNSLEASASASRFQRAHMRSVGNESLNKTHDRILWIVDQMMTMASSGFCNRIPMPPLLPSTRHAYSSQILSVAAVVCIVVDTSVVTFVCQLRNSRLQRYRRFLKGVPALNDKRSVRGKLLVNLSSGLK